MKVELLQQKLAVLRWVLSEEIAPADRRRLRRLRGTGEITKIQLVEDPDPAQCGVVIGEGSSRTPISTDLAVSLPLTPVRVYMDHVTLAQLLATRPERIAFVMETLSVDRLVVFGLRTGALEDAAVPPADDQKLDLLALLDRLTGLGFRSPMPSIGVGPDAGAVAISLRYIQ
jgi:hypothetical protein